MLDVLIRQQEMWYKLTQLLFDMFLLKMFLKKR